MSEVWNSANAGRCGYENFPTRSNQLLKPPFSSCTKV